MISKEIYIFWVLGVYQQLSRYLARSPSDKHALDEVAQQFAVSRKLKREGIQFREVLTEVRLAHALYLIQSGYSNVAQLVLACGYQSEGRFSQRFKDKFGLTPTDYFRTITA